MNKIKSYNRLTSDNVYMSIHENNSEKIEGVINVQDYTTTWENIFKTRYRNLSNGEIKDIKKLFSGPIAMLYNGIKIFNGGDDIDIDIIHRKHGDYVKISPFKDAIKRKQNELSLTTEILKNYNLKLELKELKEQSFIFPMSMKIAFVDTDKLNEFILKLRDMQDIILFGTNIYNQPIQFNLFELKFLYYSTLVPSLVFHTKDYREIYFDITKPIHYRQIKRKIVNKDIDPWGEENWDDSYFERKKFNFANYKLNEMIVKNDNLEVGDRVEVIEHDHHFPIWDSISLKLIGRPGTIIEYDDESYEYLVEFDEFFSGGHSGYGHGKQGHCRYLDERLLKKIEITIPKIKWYSKGRFNKYEGTNE